MYYQSTRSNIKATPAEAVLKGLAPDGGLYVYPGISELGFDWKKCVSQDFQTQSAMILRTMLPGFGEEKALLEESYRGKFEKGVIAPTVKVGDMYVTELFHGPTSAFKDVALSVLPRLITRGKEITGDSRETVILTATSGDTGKAALEGFADVPGTKIIVFFPSEGVSDVQKAQMVTTAGGNVKVCAVDGNFDVCQAGVKNTFASMPAGILKELGIELSSANSINIGRLVPQIAYYFSSYSSLVNLGAITCGDEIDFTVPTGNFGDILAGFYARELGLPIGQLVCASNSNNILTDFINTGIYDRNRPFFRTTSPSMDILVSSNLERLLYHVSGNDCEYVVGLMRDLSDRGNYRVSDRMSEYIRSVFPGAFSSEKDVRETIRSVWHDYRYLCDPHTAVAWDCACKTAADRRTNNKMVVLSTASPFKFPRAVLDSLGEDTSGDDFSLLRRLSDISGLDAPRNLAVLKDKEVLHRDIIAGSSIKDYVEFTLRNWGKNK